MKVLSFIVKSLLFSAAFLLLFSPSALHAQTTVTVTGKVTDPTGKPLQNVTVEVKGTTTRTTSSTDGTFTLAGLTGKEVLVFSSVGHETQEAAVNDRSLINISLAVSEKMLEDVVVIGYGTQKKRNVTSAVSNYDAKNLDQRPVLRVDQALVGQMAGVTVKQTSGSLGKGFSIQVRGSGSITAGNEPLYVLDGFPLAGAAPNGSGNFATGNPLDNINPNDIESIQVLKDAAAAAIYGSRAANGVVLITTKKGQSGKARINLNTYVGYMERSRKLDMLSGEEWIDRSTEIINAQWEASAPGRLASQTNEERRVILGLGAGQVNTGLMTDDRWFQAGYPGLRLIDWQDEAFRKGLVQNHQVSASGGNENVRYYVSGNYTRQEGMIINTDYTAYSARANVEVNASKRLKVGININPTYSVNNDPGVEGKDNILHQLVGMTPVQEDSMGLYNNVGKNGQYRWSVSPNSPIGKLQNVIGRTTRFRTITSVYGELEIIKGLALKTTVNLDNTDNVSKSYTPYIVASNLATRQSQTTALNSGSYGSFRKQTLVNENTISYNTVIKSVHDISLLGGMSYNQDKIDRVALSSTGGFNSAVINTLNAANGITGNTTETRNVLVSYFGRLQYGYADKYLLSASIRKDGSSRFGANTRWGLFPSMSLGWRIIEENFMKNFTFLSDLKVRGSWGEAGNYNIGDYSAIPLLGVYNYTFNGAGASGQAPSGITNPDLAWEKSRTVDVGVDFGFLRNRITGSFDIYSRLSSSLLLNVPIPGVTGFQTYLSNAGSVRNKGWELELTSRNMTGNFQWTTSVNLSHNSNKVVDLAGGQSQILIPSSFDIPHSILQIGQPMYSIYAVQMNGTLSAEDIARGAPLFGSEKEGDPEYVDANKDGVIDANDRVIVGHPNPDYIWGINNNFRYKGFDLAVLVQGQNGGHIYSLLGRALGRTGQGFTDNALGTYRNRWRSAADPGDGVVSKAYSTFGRIINTDWLYKSDYVRVRNITLGYDLGSVLKVKQVAGARVYLTLENFFGHDKYKGGFNPEASNTDLSGSSAFPEPGDYGGGPLPRSLIVGVNFTF
jgi:TonB-linked SusC/RagA family outer membrane protein